MPQYPLLPHLSIALLKKHVPKKKKAYVRFRITAPPDIHAVFAIHKVRHTVQGIFSACRRLPILVFGSALSGRPFFRILFVRDSCSGFSACPAVSSILSCM